VLRLSETKSRCETIVKHTQNISAVSFQFISLVQTAFGVTSGCQS